MDQLAGSQVSVGDSQAHRCSVGTTRWGLTEAMQEPMDSSRVKAHCSSVPGSKEGTPAPAILPGHLGSHFT